MLQQRWVAPDQIDADMRQEVQLPKLARALGADLGTPAGQQVVGEALTKASKALDIDVNPRSRHLGRPEDAAGRLPRAVDHPAHEVHPRAADGGLDPAAQGGPSAAAEPEVGSAG
ncbi:hypothetical protein SBADM41S_01013 [Streptomyces badius]